jgi:hypothetical protein
LRNCYAIFADGINEEFSTEEGFRRALIVGPSGCGKSVFGLMMAFQYVDDGNVVLYEHMNEKFLILGEIEKIIPEQLAQARNSFKIRHHLFQEEKGLYLFSVENHDLWNALRAADSLIHVQDLGDNAQSNTANLGNGRKIILSLYSDRLEKDLTMIKCFMPKWSPEELEDACDRIPDFESKEREDVYIVPS